MNQNAKYDRVQLFVTCLVDAFYPDTGLAVVKLLEHLGFTVEFPQAQTCCGQIAFNAGLDDDARQMARHNIDLLYKAQGYIVLPSGSCADMMLHHYSELFKNEPSIGAKVQAIKERTFEFTQFLVDELEVVDLKGKLNGRVTYHPSCHGLRNLGLRDQSLKLLRAVEGLEVIPLPEAETCCGFGGLFAIKMGDISGAMLQRKLRNIDETKAALLVGSDASCLMHMSGGLKRRSLPVQAQHIAELLCEACNL